MFLFLCYLVLALDISATFSFAQGNADDSKRAVPDDIAADGTLEEVENAPRPQDIHKKSLLLALMDQVKLNVPSQGLAPLGAKPADKFNVQLRSSSNQNSLMEKAAERPDESTEEEDGKRVGCQQSKFRSSFSSTKYTNLGAILPYEYFSEMVGLVTLKVRS